MLPNDYYDLKLNQERGNKNKCKAVIVKPESGCQGRGIYITSNIHDIQQNENCIVQKYLTQPLLIDNLKFDLRIYVLVAGVDPLRLYVYNEGLARFATEEYQNNIQNYSNTYMHLTNFAINKDHPNYEANAELKTADQGHKRSLTSVFEVLENEGFDSSKIWHQIKKIIIKTFCSVQPFLAHTYRSCQSDNYANNMCFEVLGFDIILDKFLKPWLLEVNHTPSFQTQTPLDLLVKKGVIQEAINIMNVNVLYKKKLLRQQRKEKYNGKRRMFGIQRQEYIEQCQLERDEQELSQCENYEPIYPLQNTLDNMNYHESQDSYENKYEKYFLEASKFYQICTTNLSKKQKEYKVFNLFQPYTSPYRQQQNTKQSQSLVPKRKKPQKQQKKPHHEKTNSNNFQRNNMKNNKNNIKAESDNDSKSENQYKFKVDYEEMYKNFMKNLQQTGGKEKPLNANNSLNSNTKSQNSVKNDIALTKIKLNFNAMNKKNIVNRKNSDKNLNASREASQLQIQQIQQQENPRGLETTKNIDKISFFLGKKNKVDFRLFQKLTLNQELIEKIKKNFQKQRKQIVRFYVYQSPLQTEEKLAQTVNYFKK